MLTWTSAALLFFSAGATAYYLRTAARRPRLVYQANARSAALVAQLPRLSRRFWPTPWLFNGHLQIAGLCLREALAAPLHYDRVDSLRMADGGTTELHWLGLDLPADTPTLVVLHTIMGTAQSMRAFVRDLQRMTGWRIVLCQRRGHGALRLTSPKFNTMGDVDDLRHQLRVIAEALPRSPLYAAGVSAGTGLMIRYLGEQGDDTPIRAAFAFCPGYDISVAFGRSKAPYTRIMAKRLVEQFIAPNRDALQHLASLGALETAQSLEAFQRHLYECAGYASQQDYLAACNPVGVMQRVSVPLLVLNAEDDPVCVAENVEEHLDAMRQLPNAVLAVTSRGSHCAYLAGLGASPWAHQLAAEFLLAAHAAPSSGTSLSPHG